MGRPKHLLNLFSFLGVLGAPWRLGGSFCLLILLTAPLARAGGLTGTYFPYNDFVGESVTQIDRVMDLQWSGKAPPAPGVRADNFSVRWDGQIEISKPGEYQFAIQTDGSLARLWIDGRLIIDGWHNVRRAEFTGSVMLTGGQKHRIRVDYNDSFGASYFRLLWKPPGEEQSVVPEAALSSLASSRQSLKIHFAPPKAQPVEGYLADSGAIFGDRGNGMQFGWDADVSSGGMNIASGSRPDTQYSSSIDMVNHRWEIALPNGMYRMRVVASGPNSLDPVCNIDVEGKPAIRNKVTAFNRFLDVTTRAIVTDGRLTISAADGSKNAALSFVEIEPTDDSDRLLSWLQIGLVGNNRADRCTPPSIKTGGWRQYFRETAARELRAGAKRILLSNPFGALPDETMQCDQLLHAKEAGCNWIDRDFVATWKPITASGIEVIAYFGAVNDDPEFKKLLDPATHNKGWFDRFFASIQPALDAGMSVAFDGAIMMPESSPLFEAITRLRAMNVPVYVEARPALENPWATNFPVICVEDFWRKSDPAAHEEVRSWAVPNDQLTGEVIRFIQTPPEGKTWEKRDWLPGAARSVIADGNTVAIIFDQFVRDGVDPYSVLVSSPPPATQPR